MSNQEMITFIVFILALAFIAKGCSEDIRENNIRDDAINKVYAEKGFTNVNGTWMRLEPIQLTTEKVTE